jgi:hypothetical protein
LGKTGPLMLGKVRLPYYAFSELSGRVPWLSRKNPASVMDFPKKIVAGREITTTSVFCRET